MIEKGHNAIVFLIYIKRHRPDCWSLPGAQPRDEGEGYELESRPPGWALRKSRFWHARKLSEKHHDLFDQIYM